MEKHHVSAVSIREGDQAMVTWDADGYVEPEDLALVLFESSKKGGKSWWRGQLAKNLGHGKNNLVRYRLVTQVASTSTQ